MLQGIAVLVMPSRFEVVGVIGRLLAVEVDDSLDGVLLAVRFDQHRMRRKVEPVGRECQMTTDLACGLEVFGQERRRHRERLARVVEAFQVRRVDGKFPSRTQVHTRQIADGVAVLCVAQPVWQDPAGVASSTPTLGVSHLPNPRDHLLLFLTRRLGLACGGHLTGVEPIHDQRPARVILDDGVECLVALQIELCGRTRPSMAHRAVPPHERLHRLRESPLYRRLGCGQAGAGQQRHHERCRPHHFAEVCCVSSWVAYLVASVPATFRPGPLPVESFSIIAIVAVFTRAAAFSPVSDT